MLVSQMVRREAASRWRSCFFAFILVLLCIGTANCLQAVTNSRTTLLSSYGLYGDVITTIEIGVAMEVYCRVSDISVYDDPYWLNVTVGVFNGWVADYYTDCGGTGFCMVPDCL